MNAHTNAAVAAHYTCDVLLAGLVRSLDTLKAPRAKLEILEFSCAVLGQGQPAGGPSSPHHIK